MLGKFQSKFLINLPFWIGAAIAALVAVFYAKLFAWGEEWALTHTQGTTLLWTAPLAILVSFLLGHFFSKEALGSGIPQIIAATELAKNESSLLEKLLSLKMIVVKIFGSCICVLGGGSTGREGPTLHVSAAIFYQVAKFWPRSLPKPTQSFMILAGGAGGLAAAFNTPLGGIVFAIEELSKSHINQVRTAVFQAVLIAGIISQMMLGNYLYLGHPQLDLSSHWIVLQTLFIAAVVGFIGAFFAESLFRIGNWRKRQSFSVQLGMTIGCGLAFALTFWLCGPATIGGGKTFMAEILTQSGGNLQGGGNILLPLGRYFGNFFTYIGGVVGGIFAPSLASGAAIAQYLSLELGFQAPRIMMLTGMVAFLTGVTRTPLTAFVLVLEMSDSHEAVLYLILSSFVASLAARLVNGKSFYEQVAHQIESAAAGTPS